MTGVSGTAGGVCGVGRALPPRPRPPREPRELVRVGVFIALFTGAGLMRGLVVVFLAAGFGSSVVSFVVFLGMECILYLSYLVAMLNQPGRKEL
jgi:hypothetical protein